MDYQPFVTVYKPKEDWKAILMTWDHDLEEYIPLQTGYSGYGHKSDAISDGKRWAKAEGMDFKIRRIGVELFLH
jgi:hypothetical protein